MKQASQKVSKKPLSQPRSQADLAGSRDDEISPPPGDPRDVVDDVMRKMREQSLVPEDVLNRIEQEVRAEYGGERAYIARVGEIEIQVRNWRDERIRAEYGRGEHIPLLSRRWHLSERRIRQIVERRKG